MDNGTALLAERETSSPEYAKVEAMAYRHGMTVEQYAIALAIKAELPQPKTEGEMFAEIGADLENARAKAKSGSELQSLIVAAVAKLKCLEVIQKEVGRGEWDA